MAKDCSNASFVGAIEAHRTIHDGPLFDELRLDDVIGNNEMSGSYARVINKIMDRQAKRVDASKTLGGQESPKRVLNSFKTWESLVPKKYFKQIDKRMTQWDNLYQSKFGKQSRMIQKSFDKKKASLKKQYKGDELKSKMKSLEGLIEQQSDTIRAAAKKEYRRIVGKPLSQDLKNLNKVIEKYGVEGELLDAKLKQLGLTREDTYFTNEYMKWLQGGGPYFDRPSSKGVGEGINGWLSNLAKNKVRFNPKIAAYNFTEVLQKAPTLGYKNTMTGMTKAFKAASDAGTSIFGRLPELENKGIYGNDFNPMRVEGKYDPVALSQNMLDNIGYYVGKEAGDYQLGLKEIAYRPKPWNDAAIFSGGDKKNLLGWMTFQTRHMQQYGGWARDMFGFNRTAEQRGEAFQKLATYSLMTGLLFGDDAAVPAPLWALMDEYVKKSTDGDETAASRWREFSEDNLGEVGVLMDRGLINIATGGKVDMGNYARPLGGVAFGITMDMFNTLIDVKSKAGKFLKAMYDENPAAAAGVAATTILQYSQLHTKGAADPIVRASDAVTKFYLDGHDWEDMAEEMPKAFIQKFFGRDAVGKDDAA